VTHLGQQLSALIDGELEASERERVFTHMARCGSCRDEVVALRTIKQRMHALGEAAAGAALTGRLIGLSQLLGLDDASLPGAMRPGESSWPPPPPPGGWPANRQGRQDQRAGRLFLAGSVVIFLAGLGTAAVIAGGEPQARAPAPAVTPSVDVLVAPHSYGNQGPAGGPGSGVLQRRSRDQWSLPDVDGTYLPGLP